MVVDVSLIGRPFQRLEKLYIKVYSTRTILQLIISCWILATVIKLDC